MTSTPETKTSAASPTSTPSSKGEATPHAVEDFARIDAVDRIRSAVRTDRLEKTLEEQRRGDKNDASSRWRRAGLMAEQLGKQDAAPEPAVKGQAASSSRLFKKPTSPPQSPPASVDSLTSQLRGTSFFDKLPFSFKNEAEKEEFIRESKVLTKRMEDQNWLEMLDPKHRYGSNLKHYHRYWNLKADTKQNFLQWLDEGDGKDLSLEECPRSKLEAERISYLTADQRRNYMTYIDNDQDADVPAQTQLEDLRARLKPHGGKGRLRWCRTGQLVSTSKYDHGDLGKGRGVALRQSQEWQDAIATGDVCEVVRDDKIKYRRTNSTGSSDSFTSDSSSSDEELPSEASPTPETVSAVAGTSRSRPPKAHPDEKQQTRKEKLLEKANLGPKYLIKQKLGLYASADRQQIVKGDSEAKEDQEAEAKESASRPDALIRRRKADTWIFVTDLSYNLYIGIKQRGRFQHSSLLAGSLVTVAGVLKIKDGVIVSIYPWSGHYRSSSQHFEEFIRRLQERGLDTSQINVTKAKYVMEVVNRYGMYRKKKDRKIKDVKDWLHEAWHPQEASKPTS
ncbi:hypothetical protein PSEUBRA_002752 [Kalmanozyma brasiliensis GHG001]|uniref:IQ calmodulin-binding motif protein n=1 Tax=Kalmanozyma brasiliensis (strain GHG001) TaxID=1365824 RepID=V5EYA1_KALBG|nr:uncharacterized protein PSEUBRA_002752 [Kalmanozyma brasiliensis GHG001]EST07659.1 hypothetical protein PSEUBRA_002752 [Kalmanozyma brasiliensis GHG001]